MDVQRIESLQQFISLWQDIYNKDGRPCWDGILPYYHQDIVFKDSVQEIRGKTAFVAMTRRLARRSRQLRFIVHRAMLEGSCIFIEWEMVIAYKLYPSSSVYGASRLLLSDGLVVEQRDYYDLWGDIFDNIPLAERLYRRFMRRSFG